MTTPIQQQTRLAINTKHSVIERNKWGQKIPNIKNLVPDWDYTDIALHHSGNFGKKDPKAVEHEHMIANGYDDVGYHYMVHPDGRIFEGRKIYNKGSHVYMANTGKIGILLMGDYNEQWWDFDDTLTKSHIKKVNALITTLKNHFPTVRRLGGHKEFLPNSGYTCPGNLIMKKLAGLRRKHGLSKP